MSLAEFNPVFRVFGEVTPILKKYLSPEQIEKMDMQLKSQEKDATPVIMIYGVYNAGKSTLINALIGKEVARIADKPETDRVDPYRWNGFELLDTPGIDAPIQHENVTLEQLERTDVVVFVLSSRGTTEELKTFELIVDLVKRERRVMIVVNNKTELSPSSIDYLAIKDKIRTNLQTFAAQVGFAGNIVEIVPIEMLNAKTALKAKLEHKSTLLSYSGLPSFENKLTVFLSGTTVANVLDRLGADVKRIVDEAFIVISERISKSDAAKQDLVQNRLERERSLLETEVLADIHKAGREMRGEVRSLLQGNTDQSSVEEATDRIIETYSKRIQQKLEDALTRFENKLGQISEELGLECIETAGIHSDISLNAVSHGKVDTNSDAHINLKLPELQAVLQSLRKKDVVAALKFGKQTFPALFKGIGVKKMDTFAKNILKLKKIPNWVGFLVDAAVAAKDYYHAHKAMQKQLDDQRRYQQAIEDAVEKFSSSFIEHAEAVVLDTVSQAFDPVFEQLKLLRTTLTADVNLLVSDSEFLRKQASQLS